MPRTRSILDSPPLAAGRAANGGLSRIGRRGQMLRVVAATMIALLSRDARADETTGTWSGTAEVRGNYYWERNTRVVAPEVGLTLESPEGIRVRGHYLVDSITSASVAAGTRVDVGFTEIRHDVSLGLGATAAVGEEELSIDLSGRLSTEPDYLSKSITLSSSLLFNDKNTSLGVRGTFLQDDISSVIRGAGGVEGEVDDQGQVGTLTSINASINASHNLSPTLVLSAGYDYTNLSGYLANPYRSVSLGGAPLAESHPDARHRHVLHTRLAVYVPATDTAVHGLVRLYGDSWDIFAINPEVRVYQSFADALRARLRYRYYVQTDAFFYQDNYGADAQYYTADGKMRSFQTHLVGLQLAVPFTFLRGSGLDFLSQSTFDLSFDIAHSTSIFGDYVIAKSGFVVPFE